MAQHNAQKISSVGLIGLGLMGQGIASCLIARGLKVVAWSRSPEREAQTLERIGEALDLLLKRKALRKSRLSGWERRFSFVRSLEELKDASFIIETVKEDLELKREIYEKLEAFLPAGTVIASNTSSIPVSLLQQGRKHPERFVAMHWGEPAEVTRYLEIIPGKQTSAAAVSQCRELGSVCGKEPSVLNFDIRGFISNRLMYAMMREACHLVEIGVADLETVDRSFRNDIGWWATLAGPFRWMDLTGIPAYATVMEGLFPELCNDKALPAMMKEMRERGALGIANHKGFYEYTQAGAEEWERVWLEFTHDIRKLVEKYEKRVRP
jgi:3-hydroxybutyryl-CoA dehydrogenase